MINEFKKIDLLSTEEVDLSLEINLSMDDTVLTGFSECKLIMEKFIDDDTIATKEFSISDIYTKLIPMLDAGFKSIHFKEFIIGEKDTIAIEYFLKNTDFANLIVNFATLSMKVESMN